MSALYCNPGCETFAAPPGLPSPPGLALPAGFAAAAPPGFFSAPPGLLAPPSLAVGFCPPPGLEVPAFFTPPPPGLSLDGSCFRAPPGLRAPDELSDVSSEPEVPVREWNSADILKELNTKAKGLALEFRPFTAA